MEGLREKVKIIGITGKSGSGKSTLTDLLSKEMQCNSVNIDKIGHKATSNQEIAKRLCAIFGNHILGKDGNIDRKKLGNIVFSSKEKMAILTDMTWDYMQVMMDDMLQKETGDVIILEWALLPISKYWQKCDVKILMQSDDTQRKNKVMERDHISEEYFLKREEGGIDYAPYDFDFIFENDYQLQTMEKKVDIVNRKIQKEK